MLFYSTRRQSEPVSFREALFLGQASDGGLFMPERIPSFSLADLEQWRELSYGELAYALSERWLGDAIDSQTLRNVALAAYDWELPLHPITTNVFAAELWHGPTLAFKDFAARWLGHLIGAMKSEDPLTVLVATSGDTGSAVAAGFYGVPGVRVVILYPSGRVSHVQEQQLTTFGGNVTALEVAGTFDDCQRLVKQAFADVDFRRAVQLTSANSISIGRLLPQVFYYVWSYLHAVHAIGDPVIFCVPSGNVGNLTAGLIAKRMGLPVARFIVAANKNTPLIDYLTTGIYEPRSSLATLSNAMDVGNPSNIVRIFDMYPDVEMLRKDLWGTSVDDDATRSAIKTVYSDYGYIMDPHTAVGWTAIERYQQEQKIELPIVLMSTAHPAKFIETVEDVLGKGAVAMPPQLASALAKQKQSIPIDTAYDALKRIITE